MDTTIFFNAHHSPMGAFASLTLGCTGAKGGLGLELGKPSDQNIYIGLESTTPGVYEALPFFAGSNDEAARYDVEKRTVGQKEVAVIPFSHKSITRDFKVSSDTWKSGDLTFTVYSPVFSVPDPASVSDQEMMLAVAPAVIAELTIDNSACDRSRTCFFGYQGNDPYCSSRFFDTTELVGVGQGQITAIAAPKTPNITYWQSFGIQDALAQKVTENQSFGLGRQTTIVATVAAGTVETFRFAVCFYRGGKVTAGLDTTYYYTCYFSDIEAVAAYVLKNFDTLKERASVSDGWIDKSQLSKDQKFQLAHSIRSYYGSTEFLANGTEPFWVVNEGEYRMMNTFDLTVDHLFFEMKMNPWTTRNVLDMYVNRYSYYDTVRFRGDSAEYPGGRSFTHDMGVGNVVSRPHYSAYERFNLDGCFSHMTHEQLVNWVLCAAVYVQTTQDQKWLDMRLGVFKECFESMCNRDNPDPSRRNGVMSLDSSRTMNGAEITTYDSLDVSLGQSRNNLYMAVKCWAAYIALDQIFKSRDQADLAAQAMNQATRCAGTIESHMTIGGYIPAVFDENNDSKIIPAVEGLIFPLVLGCSDMISFSGPFGSLMSTLKKHVETVLKPGTCLFADGGWKLSSTSNNSWLSKVYLCQHVCRTILGIPHGETGRVADAAHVAWLMHPESIYYAWSDQMLSGVAHGSKYYPRGVTSVLWLDE